MTLRFDFTAAQTTALRAPAAVLLGAALLFSGVSLPLSAQSHSGGTAPQSPYGGTTVEDIVARINDQIITRSDYDRVVKEVDDEARQRGETMQQIAEGHKDTLRDLIDQQLWISKGKELDLNVDTEVVKQLDEIRKKYNLASLEDLEKAAKEQGISFEDYKANIKNQIMTQEVMRQEVGRRVQVTPGEAERYFQAHKQEYAQPESIRLSEILVSTGEGGSDDPQKLAAAKAKADDIEAKLKAGASFDQLARTGSDGQTAAEGGDMGKFGRGQLNKVFEDKTFALKAGEVTDPIRTKQGYVIFKVTEHIQGGVPAFKDVQDQVEESYYMSRMQPAIRAYLQTMREQAYIQIANGYTDSAATPNEVHPTITYSAYTPPAPKKKKKVERTRFRETEHGFRSKPNGAVVPVSADTTPAKPASSGKSKASAATPATMKAGKKEKIRYGQAPRETLPNSTPTKIEDAGALPKDAAPTEEADNAAVPAAPVKKTRYSARAVEPKAKKARGPQLDSFTPAPPDAAEVADRQVQNSALGLNGETAKPAKKKKSDTASSGPKKRMKDRPKSDEVKPTPAMTPAAPVAGAPAPATAPKPADTSPQQ